MARYLILSPAAPRTAESRDVVGLAHGLITSGHTVTVLAPASTDVVAQIPGLARRLRKLKLSAVGGEWSGQEANIYEGRFSAAEPQIIAVESPPKGLSALAPLLGAIAEELAEDPWLRADAIIGWGEVTALALGPLQGSVKFLVLPNAEVRDPDLAQVGANAAQAVLVPHLGQAAALQKHRAFATRASDEPIAPFRLGSDEPPRDPASDPALPHRYSLLDPTGKALCRRLLARRLGLTLGPRTALLAVTELGKSQGNEALLDAIANASETDVAIAIWAEGDRTLVERASLLALEHPTRVALVRPRTEATDGDRRFFVAAADAVWIGVGTGQAESVEADRRAGLAQRYGTLPILPHAVGSALGLVEVDAGSCTGNALYAANLDAACLAGVLVRMANLRANEELWAALTTILMRVAPTWRAAAQVFEAMRTRVETGVEARLAI